MTRNNSFCQIPEGVSLPGIPAQNDIALYCSRVLEAVASFTKLILFKNSSLSNIGGGGAEYTLFTFHRFQPPAPGSTGFRPVQYSEPTGFWVYKRDQYQFFDVH